MKKKNNLFKNIFYIFFAICFLSLGTFSLDFANKNAMAENTQGTEVENVNIPDYFSVKEYENSTEVLDGLVSSNIFLYAPSKTLKISLATNGVEVFGSLTNSVYEYVYYPNTEDTSKFYFYNITGVELTINGTKVDGLVDTNFITNTGKYFTNYSDTLLQTFEMNFTETGAGNSVKLTDNLGNIIEGQYTLTLNYILYQCDDGKTDASEDYVSFSNKFEQVSYNFYVVGRDNYLTNGIPNVAKENFDHEVNSPSTIYDFYLYSNYTLKNNENKIAYLEYDYTRYEIELNKELANGSFFETLLFDTENNTIVSSGDEIVSYTTDETNHTAKIFFYDLGNYAVTYKDILLVDYAKDGTTTLQKHYLSGLSNITKKMLVYVYGFQANYTDMDGELDSNNTRPLEELKKYIFENESFEKSADITSEFVNSNANYSQENGTETFTISKILTYIENNNISPVVTNQTPVKFTSNATLASSTTGDVGTIKSYIYSTKKISANYEDTDLTLTLDGKNEDIYRARFNGQAEGAVGKYIYLIAYTFTNYYSTPATRAADKIFYQVFYFEISKNLPSISVKTIDGQTVYSDSYTNKYVVIDNTTQQNPYNRDVEVRIYAKDFSGNYVDGFDHESGVDFASISSSNIFTLTQNAHYTIRMYNKSEVTPANILLSSKTGFFREQTFTIDNSQITGISATNVSEIVNSTNYEVVSTLNTISTNQNIVLSWNEKDSGARTYAYYRYFKIEDFQYYSTVKEYISDSIKRMVQYSSTDTFLPINYTLNMSTTNNNWFNYEGNAESQIKLKTVPSDYVLSDEGLYLIEVCDEAGNKSFEILIIDYTTPLFALQDADGYTLANGSTYISQETTIYWSKYKSLYISNLKNSLFGTYTPASITEAALSGDALFVDHEGNANSIEIFTTLYDRLKNTKYMQTLVNENKAGTGSALDGQPYTGMYFTVPINSTYYYLSDADDYEEKTNAYKETISVDISSSESERIYRVLIRDYSNTKFDPSFSETDVTQYTQYYSATQKLSVSFDTSNFRISYSYQSGSQQIEEDLGSNKEVVKTAFLEESGKEVSFKTTYLNPTRMSQAFKLYFTPTQIEGDSVIQVDKVSIKYYKYEQATGEGNFAYYRLSSDATETVIYEYTGENETTEKSEAIRLTSDGKTMPGKYEITRIYNTGNGFTYNENDYYSRTFVLYVDRNDVISNPDLIGTEGSEPHLESLVGGDIFISMYDNKENANLVVTFPDSTEGNQKGSSLYNNGVARTIFTTNMLPVNIYIPKYKYTINAEKVLTSNGYNFVVNNNNQMNLYDINVSSSTSFDPSTSYISEYVLYAQVYFNDMTNLIAESQASLNASSTNGFLDLFTPSGERLNQKGLTEAGSYYVKIYQGFFGTEIGVNNYLQSITFTFDIEATSPNFVATTNAGAELNNRDVDGKTTYYTNNSSIKLSWEAGSDYMAEIDIDNIVFAPNNSRPITSREIGNEIWGTPVLSKNNIYTATLNLQKLGIYQNDGYVDITMQYKNHDDNLYSKVTKRIVIDLSAPSANISNLVQKSTSGSMFSNLKESTLRIYNTANMEVTTDLSITSYNISNGTGNFAYYSYMVTSDYKQTLLSSMDYMTYVRKFEDSSKNVTKYTANAEQETSPATFLASNFTQLEQATFEVGSYYEIVETDRAGNMAIYTIYVTSYDQKDDELNNLITYTDSDGETTSYTIADYYRAKSYSGALNNIYDKLGLQLENINYFGDAWAQFKLDSVSASGITTTYYLMLSPWDPTHAFAFVNDAKTSYDITALYDGSINSRYKSSLSFYNRENGQTDKFYINTRNTDLVANMTDTQNREYIKFDCPTDASINSEYYASTYLTKLKISTSDSVLFEQENALGFASLWQSNNNVTVTYDQASGKIMFEINSSLNFPSNTKIVYEFTNNYGKEYTEVHLYRETIIKTEISSENDLYAYYTSNGHYYYITQNGFQYYYNPNKYSVAIYDFVNGQKSDEEAQNATIQTATTSGVRTITLRDVKEENYNDTFVIEVSDITTATLVKTIYVTLYNELPIKNLESTANTAGQFKLLDATRNNITQRITESLSSDEMGYFSEVTLTYSLANTFIPVKYSFSTDMIEWTEAQSGTKFVNTSDDIATYYLKIWYDTTYLKNEFGSSEYVFQNVPSSRIYEFNLSSLTSTFWVEKTVDGVTTIVERSNTIFKIDGRQYSNHYIVNLNYTTDKNAVQIKTNKEQGITATQIGEAVRSGNVVSELWRVSNEDSTIQNISKFSTFIVVTYIPTSNDFVGEFFTYNSSGIIDTSDNLKSKTRKDYVISQESTSIGKLKLQWTKYNGIVQNEIKITIVKDGIEMTPTIYSENNYNFCYLPYSGKYLISLYDTAGNVQKFNYGSAGQSDIFTLIFLKDVPFTITYTNPETNEIETSLPNKQAVYNGEVSLNIDNTTRTDFYQVGGYPTVKIKRNGVEMEGNEYKTTNDNGKTRYYLTESGSYEVTFTATSKLEGVGIIKQETYQFSIINKDEHRYSYIVNSYSNYYIESVKKNGTDITENLIKTLNTSTITINKTKYLAELPLSYLDEKTGAGTYLIRVNSNSKDLVSASLPTTWTFQVIVKSGTAPVTVSIEEGKSTDNAVTVNYNKANIFEEMGECKIQIVKYDRSGKYLGVVYSEAINSTSTGQATASISREQSGTFYVQIVSSNNVLYSYKVSKSEPMNTAAIIAIIAAAVLAVVVLFIVIKLRKRISVK